MNKRDSADLYFLLEDYGRSLESRVSEARTVRLAPSDRPIWLSTADFGLRLRWQHAQDPAGLLLPPSDTRPPEFLVRPFDPVRQFHRASGSGIWPVDSETPLRLETPWTERPFPARALEARAVSIFLHAVGLALLLIPGTQELEFAKPADWDSMRFTLMAPPLDDLPPLRGKADVPGDGEGEFRGLPQPPSEPAPAPAPEPETPEAAEPAQEEEAVPQPIEQEEPETPEESPALEEAEESEQAELPAAQSPAPGEFQRGRELAQARDPRLLPMPLAPSRKRAALQLESPKASMPSRRGSAQLGTLDLTARPDQVIEGAIQQMIRGGGPRQAVGDGFGGAASAGILPPGPSSSGSLVELLSDPRGVDFRPYLTQILASIRRNWFAVIPESARLGMSRGRTLIQFSVARNGSVPKLVIAKASGTPPLDRAAVAGISASNPFPPLPREYLGGDIRLQFTFLYNMRNP